MSCKAGASPKVLFVVLVGAVRAEA